MTFYKKPWRPTSAKRLQIYTAATREWKRGGNVRERARWHLQNWNRIQNRQMHRLKNSRWIPHFHWSTCLWNSYSPNCDLNVIFIRGSFPADHISCLIYSFKPCNTNNNYFSKSMYCFMAHFHSSQQVDGEVERVGRTATILSWTL